MSQRFLIGAALTVVCSAASVAVASPAQDRAAILKIERDMAAAQTVDQIVASWDKDAVWYDVFPGDVVGLAAIRKDLGGQVARVTNIRTTILRMNVEASDQVAFVYSVQHLVADGKDGAPGLDMVFRETDGFVKKSGAWKLLHQHISLPIDPVSAKAVFDSK